MKKAIVLLSLLLILASVYAGSLEVRGELGVGNFKETTHVIKSATAAEPWKDKYTHSQIGGLSLGAGVDYYFGSSWFQYGIATDVLTILSHRKIDFTNTDGNETMVESNDFYYPTMFSAGPSIRLRLWRLTAQMNVGYGNDGVMFGDSLGVRIGAFSYSVFLRYSVSPSHFNAGFAVTYPGNTAKTEKEQEETK